MYITYKDHIHPCYPLFLSAVLLILCLLPLSLLPIFMFVCVDVCRSCESSNNEQEEFLLILTAYMDPHRKIPVKIKTVFDLISLSHEL